MDIKYTKNFFTGNVGAKVDGQRVLKNQYIRISAQFANYKHSVMIGEKETKSFQLNDQYHVIDLKTNQPLETEALVLNTTPNYAYYFDGYEDMETSNLKNHTIESIIYKIKDETVLLHNEKEYSTKDDYSRIEIVYDGWNRTSVYLAVNKKTNKAELIGLKDYQFDNDRLKIDSPQKSETFFVANSPYRYLLLDPLERLSQYYISGLSSKKVKEDINQYFANLIEKATSVKEKQALLKEKIDCIGKIVTYFESKQAEITQKINEYEFNIAQEQKDLATIQSLSAEKQEKFKESVYKTQDRIERMETESKRLNQTKTSIAELKQDYEKTLAQIASQQEQSKETINTKQTAKDFTY